MENLLEVLPEPKALSRAETELEWRIRTCLNFMIR